MVVAAPRLGEQLRELRRRRGLSLREVALAVEDLSWQALSRVERGDRQPTTRTLEALAGAFGVSFVVDRDGIRIEH